MLYESYTIALKQANAENGNDGDITSHISEATMIDTAKDSCLSIILATIIGTAIVVAVNGLFLSEYGTNKFEETVRAKILPQLGTVLQLAVDTQLNGYRDRNADHKDSSIRKELYDARTELQTMVSPLSTYLMAARLELRFYNPSKGERMTKLFDTVNELVGRVQAVTHVLCAEENEASKELWRDAFGEVDGACRMRAAFTFSPRLYTVFALLAWCYYHQRYFICFLTMSSLSLSLPHLISNSSIRPMY